MAKINIVIADSDELYLNHLANYLIEHVNTFEVFSFTTKESLIKFIGDKSNKVDVIAFTEDLMDGTISVADVPAKILLSDGTFTELTEFDSVNKYQKADKFISDILLIYAEKTGHIEAVSLGDKETKLIGFFSPVGGSGKTTLALGTAYALAAQGKRVFYFNAEKLNSTTEVLCEGPSGSLSDLYLAVKTKGANVGLKIISNKYTDGNNLSYINPSESSLEINELTTDEFVKLMKEYETLGEFDVVVVDFDSEFSKDKIKILDTMDRIFVPFTPESLSIAKMKLYVKELSMYDELKSIKDKTYPVLNKVSPQSNAYVQSSGVANTVEIKASVALSPVFADLKNLLHSGNATVQALGAIVNNI